MKTGTNNQKGFTIIEVVLVLAIAALIFLMVFVAYPALSRGQRDSQRKADLGRLTTAVNNYSSNNRGALPSAWNTTFITQYMTTDGDSFIDPSGGDTGEDYYQLTARGEEVPTGSFQENQNTIYYTVGYKCDGDDGASVTAAGSRNVAFRMVLEGGGTICQAK